MVVEAVLRDQPGLFGPVASDPAAPDGGRPASRGSVLDIDATIVMCHSERDSATRTWKKTFSYHPLLCFLDNIGEALAGLLREGRAGSNTTANHITVLDEALAQIPDAHRHGTPILLRSRSSTSRPATALTPASRTASAAARTPASADSRPASSRSTKPGSTSR